MKPIRCLAFLCSLWLWWCGQGLAFEATTHTFFSGTQYPLAVHFLQGDKAGPTVMVQGGIQGDETAGFLTAQLLAQSRVLIGNLVVVPRANVPSILKRQRQVNVDLNRRFDRDYGLFYEDRLARAIRILLEDCQAFIHLHEGTGFYSPTYVDQLRNPFRYGQSVIIDAQVFDQRIDLARAVDAVLAQINGGIVPADHHFQLFNMDTFSSQTRYPEQRKSLTYYTLSRLKIPALAIEVSKSIPSLAWKVRKQFEATRLFLAHFGVEIEPPSDMDAGAGLDPEAIRLEVNGQRVGFGDTVTLNPEAPLEVAVVATPTVARWNPAWGVFCQGRPELNLTGGVSLSAGSGQSLAVVADGNLLGTVQVAWTAPSGPGDGDGQTRFLCRVNRQPRLIPAGQELEVVQGDVLVLEGIRGCPEGEILNLKGYVSRPEDNDGQDAGQEIVMDRGAFMDRYLLPARGAGVWRCEVVRETPDQPGKSFTVRVTPRKVDALVFRAGERRVVCEVGTAPSQARTLPARTCVLEDAWGNGPRDLVQPMRGNRPLKWGDEIRLEPGKPLRLDLHDANTFTRLGAVLLQAGS